MPDIFLGVPGTVAIFHEPDSVLPGRIKFEGSENMKFMVSGVDYKQSVDAQFNTSMERDIYTYVFGDNMGDAVIHGRVYFPCQTRGGGGGEYDSGYGSPNEQGNAEGERNGFDDILDLYADKRLSEYEDPVVLQVGKRTIKGYLTSLLVKAVGLSDEPSGLVYDFSAIVNTLPSLGSAGGGGGESSGS